MKDKNKYNFIKMTEFIIGDRVTKIKDSHYPNLNFSRKKIIPFGARGTVMRIRKRYEHTPNFYVLYVIKFDGYEYEDELIDQYEGVSLQK